MACVGGEDDMLVFAIFFVLGIFLIGLGIWIQARAYGRHSVEVDAECVEVEESDYKTSADPADYTYMKDAKRPVYRYWYQGQYYTSAPMLRSNRPGYHPQLGACKIRINPDHPERVYSSERKFASIILIGIGSLYIIMVIVLWFVFDNMGILSLMYLS